MALDAATARSRVKDLLDISDTSLDSDIDNYVTDAVNMLYPIAMAEVAPDTTKTFASGGRDVTLPSGVDQVRRLELYDDDLSDYYPTDDYIVHAGSIWLDQATSSSTQARIWGWARHTIGTVPAELYDVVFYWAASLFYSALAGNKRKYNIYIGSAGSAADRDIKDSADYYMNHANQILADRAKLAGS